MATVKSGLVRNWWYNTVLTKISNTWDKLKGDKVEPIDLIALFDVTLVHEVRVYPLGVL